MNVVRKDQGFTLIELLISISILTIIVGSISTSLIVFLKTGAETSRRDDHSAGAGLLASYLDRDLASAESTSGIGPSACSGVTGTVRLVLRWVEFTATPALPTPAVGATFESAYAVDNDPEPGLVGSGTRTRLRRFACEVGGPTTTTLLIGNLGTAGVDVSASTTGTCASGRTRLVVTLSSYYQDTAQPYSYTGCLKARLG